MHPRQLPLFSSETEFKFNYPFPSTRYQGSKRTLTNWIWDNVRQLPFESVLDAFGGTGVVSYLFKNKGKKVIYNDLLAFNWTIGVALIENMNKTLSSDEIDFILQPQPQITYPDFIQRTFKGIYFTEDENQLLDTVLHNIEHSLTNPYKQALARFALFQSCIVKRPYNLFHRANLYMRTANVKRSFGNKTTWDTPFEVHFRNFVNEANQAVFDNGQANQAIQVDALETPVGADLVYLDPPYLNKKGVGVDYRDFYHFLEGMVYYEEWQELIDYQSKHRRLQPETSLWNNSKTILDAFEQMINRHRESILVISYRDDGIPTKTQLIELLKHHKTHVREATLPKKYVLAHKQSHELLLIAY